MDGNRSIATVFNNARVVTPSGIFDGGVAVDVLGRIAAIAADESLPGGQETVDCQGQTMLPGLVDPHVHFGGPQPLEEICRTESRSAAAGGVTTVLQYRRSQTSLLEDFPDQRRVVDENMVIDSGFHFILNNMDQANEIPQYAERFGVTSYKFYMGGYAPGNPIGLVTVSDAVLMTAMAHVRELGPFGYCMVHAEDDSIVAHLTEKLKATGRTDLWAYTESRPGYVEEQDILRAIWLAELTGASLYVPHTTIGAGVDAAIMARSKGTNVLLETCPHYLALTPDEERFAEQGAGVGKVAPALRGKEDQDRLWEGLRDGHIQTVGSDHVPIAKSGAQLWEEKPGFSGVSTMLPVLITEGVLKGRLTLQRLAEVTATNPARIFGYHPRKGSISVGGDADLVLVDLETEAEVTPETTHNQYTTAFDGARLRGWPSMTVRRGEIIFRDGDVLAEPGSGVILDKIAPESGTERMEIYR